SIVPYLWRMGSFSASSSGWYVGAGSARTIEYIISRVTFGWWMFGPPSPTPTARSYTLPNACWQAASDVFNGRFTRVVHDMYALAPLCASSVSILYESGTSVTVAPAMSTHRPMKSFVIPKRLRSLRSFRAGFHFNHWRSAHGNSWFSS